uniref:ARAD1D43582p n=1 Tax=Blastobotrys adeninivorans TaxID=409370 RepID=A0A060TDG1_BLAAD
MDSDGSDDETFVTGAPVPTGTPVISRGSRKVRHVVGISLRNVRVDTREPRHRSESLAKWRRMSFSDSNTGSNNDRSDTSPRRRRSSARPDVVGAEVERALQDMNMDRLPDCMFALYADSDTSITRPYYISEVCYGTMNPEFCEIDLSEDPARHNSSLTVVAYCRTQTPGAKWQQVIGLEVDLTRLMFVGRTMDSIKGQFLPNSIIFHLTDGLYVIPGLQSKSVDANADSPTTGTSSTLASGSSETTTSCSYDTIMKLNNFEACVADADMTIASVSASIDQELASGTGAYWEKSQHKQQLRRNGQLLQSSLASEKRSLSAVQRQIKDLKQNLDMRRARMDALTKQRQAALDTAAKQREETTALVQHSSELYQQILVERGRIADALQQIFIIQPSGKGDFSFVICDLPLPKSDYDQYNEDEVGAAYGMVAQLVHLISQYLGVPLRYPVQTFGSQSFIVDPISTIQGSRTFPLWIRGALFYRFEYGVYLLHKDIEQLINAQELQIADLTHTLANLKNLLLVVSARAAQASTNGNHSS